MLTGLPMRHRAVLAVLLFLAGPAGGLWVSTQVGDTAPSVLGLAVGAVAGAAAAVAVLVAHRSPQPPTQSPLPL
jgi:hypothetical protein